MSDGYWAYREIDWRLRCLAHVIRKAHGLEESLDREAQRFGRHLPGVIATVIKAVYQARGGAPPDAALRARYAPLLEELYAQCLRHADSRHEKTRALRHWVIARRIGMGTRTAQGTRAFALLASVIETCRKRNASPWSYLAELLRQRCITAPLA